MYQHLVYKVHRRVNQVNWVQMGQTEHRCTLNNDDGTNCFPWHRTEYEECFSGFYLVVSSTSCKHCAFENKI